MVYRAFEGSPVLCEKSDRGFEHLAIFSFSFLLWFVWFFKISFNGISENAVVRQGCLYSRR